QKSGFSQLYDWQKQLERPEFVLHDGPPYANGDLHMGHVVNKVLKDVELRRQLVKGNKVRFVPGWDCHGLPIELKALGDRGSRDLDPVKIRQIARRFAEETVKKQKEGFKSWGIMANWDKPYLSFSSEYVKKELEIFTSLFEKGFIFRDFKPVHWSPVSRTALAEAELEYNNEHVSNSLYFRVRIAPETLVAKFGNKAIFAIVWTTTPWTLPGNEAVAFKEDADYVFLVDSSKEESIYVAGAENIEEISEQTGINFEIIPGLILKGLVVLVVMTPSSSNFFSVAATDAAS
ncbi:unnamed protein product, partial [Notodromas monacha]